MLRRHITGIRCASNLIPVKFLRKFNVRRDLRFCTLCNNKQVGTEVHVTMHCENGNIVKCRKEFFRLIFASSVQLQRLDTEQLFTYLLACIETNITTITLPFFLDKIHKFLKSQNKTKF